MSRGDALKYLQEQCGTTPDGAFGPNTARAIANHYGYSAEVGAHLLGQCYHESGGFQITEENLNYRAETMMRVWPSRYPDEASTSGLAGNPEALANHTYANRMGNGDGASGEGWKYRGRGFIQLTGKNNYTAFAEAVRRPNIVSNPDPVSTEYAFAAAQWFFEANGLIEIAKSSVNSATIKIITKRINGGYHGIDERSEWTRKVYNWLK